jgi:hypothetical protein
MIVHALLSMRQWTSTLHYSLSHKLARNGESCEEGIFSIGEVEVVVGGRGRGERLLLRRWRFGWGRGRGVVFRGRGGALRLGRGRRGSRFGLGGLVTGWEERGRERTY